MTLYTEGFGRFVTSTTAPIATGWSDSCRVGISPTERTRLARRTEFSGLNRNAKTARAGTVANARNIPLEWLTQDNGGSLRSRAGLEQVYGLADVPLDAEQIAFCNTGHNSSLGWFVAHELFGNQRVRLYDGSMAQWSRNAAQPMERAVVVAD